MRPQPASEDVLIKCDNIRVLLDRSPQDAGMEGLRLGHAEVLLAWSASGLGLSGVRHGVGVAAGADGNCNGEVIQNAIDDLLGTCASRPQPWPNPQMQGKTWNCRRNADIPFQSLDNSAASTHLQIHLCQCRPGHASTRSDSPG